MDYSIPNGTPATNGADKAAAPRLKVLVCGAGIAGFATALLLREDHDVTILEASAVNSELGAAVTFAMNGTRLMRTSLARAGFDHAKARSVQAEKLQDLNYKDLSVMSEWSIAQVEEAFGQPWWYFSRLDVHAELRRAAMSPDGLGPPAELVLGARVERVDSATATVYVEDGRTFTGDVVVGADGIRTATGNSVFGKLTSKNEGLYAYRCMIRSEALRKDPECAVMVDCAKVLMVNSPGRRIVAYPCSSWDWINIVAIYPDERDRRLDWKTSVTVEEMINEFKDFHPAVKKMLSYAEDTGVWQLRDRDPMSTMVKDKFALIGDASHAMGPHQGQGACQALEDAEGLRVVLKGATPDEIAKRLEVFNTLRLERVHTVQEYTRKMAPRKPDDSGAPLDPASSRAFSQYYWTHAVTKEGVELMNKNGYPMQIRDSSTAEIVI